MNISKLNFDDVDSYIVTSEHNRYYFTGFHSSFGILIATAKGSFYITDNRYGELCKKHFKGSEVTPMIISKGNGIDEVKEIISSNNLKKMGFEDNMSVREYISLKKELTVEFVAKGEYFEIIRKVKTNEEVEKIAYSMQIASKGFSEMLNHIKAGMTEKEINAEINYHMYRFGADTLSFDTIVASGINGSHPHAVPTDKIVENGDLVTIDFGVRIDGYCADITRTFGMGKVSDRQVEIYNYVKEAQQLGLDNIKEGSTGKEVDTVVREYFKSKGVNQYFNHGLGHGVGVEIHERPRLSQQGDNGELKENMIVTCEPGLYIPGELGVRIEDTVCVTKDGLRNLCPLVKELILV